MNISLFSESKTGQLVPIKVNTNEDYAFVPAPLPSPDWTFPVNLWPLLAKAKEKLGKLDGIGRTITDPNLLLSPLKSREAITSSALEGTYATPQELMLFELNPTKPKSDSDRVNEWQEVANYRRALNEGARLIDEQNMPFCKRLFRDLHAALLGGTRHRYTNPGEFRQHQVAIGSDRRYIPPTAAHLEKCLDDLEAYINADQPDLDPLIKAYLVHYQFEAIHPFYDGNGRIGRVLLSLMIYKWGEFTCPWLYMSAFFERYKDEYISKMFNISTDGAWDAWVDFCLRGTIVQAEDAIRRCDALRELKTTLLDRIESTQKNTARTHRIIDGLFVNPIVRPARLSRNMNVTYPTAKDDIRRLVDAKILVPLPGVKPMAFYSPEIFKIAYEAPEDMR